jgi:hypothetical protein
VLANAPGESGQYAITAGIGTVHHEERNYDGPNNNAAQPLFVASPPNRFREVPGTCISRQC